MQKFTRPLTREIELAGERLALTLDDQGIAVRPVGSRKPPVEISWAAVVGRLARMAHEEVPTDEIAAGLEALKAGGAARPKQQAPAPAAESPPAEGKGDSERVQDYTGLLARLDRWLADHRPRYLHDLQPGANAAELDALQKELGIPLPAGLRTLLHWHNGQRGNSVGSLENRWRMMSAADIGRAKKELDARAATTGWQKSWLPFLDDNGGDYLSLDTSQSGLPVREFWLGKPDTPVAAPSLAAWLESFISAAERGEYVEDPERGDFIRK